MVVTTGALGGVAGDGEADGGGEEEATEEEDEKEEDEVSVRSDDNDGSVGEATDGDCPAGVGGEEAGMLACSGGSRRALRGEMEDEPDLFRVSTSAAAAMALSVVPGSTAFAGAVDSAAISAACSASK